MIEVAPIVSYDVYVGEEDTFVGVTQIWLQRMNTLSNELVEDMVYYWKVIATDDDGGTKSSGNCIIFGQTVKIALLKNLPYWIP